MTDRRGTVWLASTSGLWYYNDYRKAAAPQSCRRIAHPLLNNSQPLTALAVRGDYLIIAAHDRVLALNLSDFYGSNKLRLRYLNPQVASFTSFTEQNTLITARDSTVWFSTGDMVYSWDFDAWLKLPLFKAAVGIELRQPAGTCTLSGKPTTLEPEVNSFELNVLVHAADCMPRYLSAALIRDGDSTLLPSPSLQSAVSIKNLAPGSYRFIVEVYEQDGSTARYEYPLLLKRHFWQTWWVWALFSLCAISIIAYIIHSQRQRSIARQTLRRKAAELDATKAEADRKQSELRLVTLSAQFRPHFILNALNTIGARMDDRPEIESVLSRLGESINLIFSHAQSGKVLHPFRNEWALVESVIKIQQLMYLRGLQTIMPADGLLRQLSEVQVPLGLLQIPVENALMHGLRNREEGPLDTYNHC